MLRVGSPPLQSAQQYYELSNLNDKEIILNILYTLLVLMSVILLFYFIVIKHGGYARSVVRSITTRLIP